MEVLTTTEMERADRLTIAAGTPGFALMMSAGQAVAEAAMALVEEGPIMVVAGRGNNGGDGFVAAAELAARGRDVSVILLCERDSLQGDAALAARGWKYPVLPFNPQAIGKPALIIDALFGAGLNRAGQGRPARDDRGGQRQRRAGARRRPAERDQRHDRRRDGRCDQRRGDRDLLPPQAGASADAGTQALRPGARRRYRHRSPRARGDPAADVRRTFRKAGNIPSRCPASTATNMPAAMRDRTVGRTGVHRRGAACGARCAAGRRRAGDAWPRRATRSRSTPRR